MGPRPQIRGLAATDSNRCKAALPPKHGNQRIPTHGDCHAFTREMLSHLALQPLRLFGAEF